MNGTNTHSLPKSSILGLMGWGSIWKTWRISFRPRATCECFQKRDPIPNTCDCANGNRMHGCRIGLWLYWPRDHSHGNGQDFACCGVRIPVGKCEIRPSCSALTQSFLDSQLHIMKTVTLTLRPWMLIPASWKMLWMPSESSCFSEGWLRPGRPGRPGRWELSRSQPTSTRQNTRWYNLVHDCPVELNQSEFDQSKTLKGLSARFQSLRKI